MQQPFGKIHGYRKGTGIYNRTGSQDHKGEKWFRESSNDRGMDFNGNNSSAEAKLLFSIGGTHVFF